MQEKKEFREKNIKNKEKRTGLRLRGWIQALFFAFSNGYLAGYLNAKIYRGQLKQICVPGLNCYSCPGALASCPIGALQSLLDSKKFHFSCYIFGFFLVVGGILGRAVCGFLCPFGWIQDLCYRIPIWIPKRVPDTLRWKLERMNKRKHLPGHKVLIWLKYVILAVFVILLPMTVMTEFGAGVPWFCKLICPSGTLFGGIPLVLLDEALAANAGGYFLWKVTLLALLLSTSVFVYRPFCKYLCPLGAVYSGFYKISLFRLKLDESLCIHCGKCSKTCLMGVDPEHGKNRQECIACGDCQKSCPTKAISFWLKGKDTFSS